MNNASVGIVICNYNKCDYVINCIQSVLESDTDDYAIYVADNASTDNSVSKMQQTFGDKITILVNEENLGGSGGFNRGIREAIKAGHPYIMCLDNDVLVDESAVSSLQHCLKEHEDIGMVGSRVYHMEEPDYVQQFGLNIDFDNYIVETLYENVYEDGSIPELIYCDTVATCSVMLRSEAIKAAGIMPEENFIYWDDVEWGLRISKAGYRVAACGASKVLHTKGAGNRNNSVFTNYYNVRNSIHFFMKYISDGQLEDFARQMLISVFDSMYERMYRDEHSTALAILYGLDDAIHGIYGKAEDYKLQKTDTAYGGLYELMKDKTSYSIEENGFRETADAIRQYISEAYPDIKEAEPDKSDVILTLCDYIMNVKDFSLTRAYVDVYENVFSKAEEAELIKNYSFSRELFVYTNMMIFIENMKKQRKN